MDTKYFEPYRKEFPVTDKYIYLDHAGVAPISLRVKKAIEQFLSESVEGGGFHYPKWLQRIIEVRRSCAKLINSESDELAFVKNTSHGLSIAAEGLDWKQGDNVLIYEKEFPSNIYPWMNLQRKGVDVRVIPSRDGKIILEDIEGLINARTRLIAISSVQFANGFRINLKNLGNLCKSKRVLLFVDAIQSLGVFPVDVKAFNIDFLSADAHKWLLGPEGIGIFYCKKELTKQISPPLIGWKSVKNDLAFDQPDFDLKSDALRFEEGSMNVMGIYGLGAAVDLLLEVGVERVQKQVLELGDFIIREAEARGYRALTPKDKASRGGNITFSGMFEPSAIRDALNTKGIMVNCRGGGLRVSPHFYNTNEDLKRFFIALEKVVAS